MLPKASLAQFMHQEAERLAPGAGENAERKVELLFTVFAEVGWLFCQTHVEDKAYGGTSYSGVCRAESRLCGAKAASQLGISSRLTKSSAERSRLLSTWPRGLIWVHSLAESSHPHVWP